ncbi:MAG: hypothetical protein KKC18_05205 [Chloroflexi bacterium]|nr:hypothetical protein [Chloroflexota bacterium]
MARTIKHFSLQRIAGTELRVVSDVESGVLPVVQVEEAVIRGYAQEGLWPHRWVTLFVLQDMQPLVRQLTSTPSLPLPGGGSEGGGPALPPGGAAALNHRPVVNVYDRADPAGCHVFVNQQAMVKEGYWDDPLAVQGLLAHEHAHPLAENETARASRRLQVELSMEPPPSDTGQRAHDRRWTVERQDKIHRLLTLLVDKLCLYAPREIFANEVTIHSGFGEALLHLDRRNVANASRSVAGREELRQHLQQEVTQGTLTPAAADLLLLIGDLKGYLDLALEVAPFYRAGRESDARELEAVLETSVLPHLEPEVSLAYSALREQYVALHADLAPPELVAWGEGVLGILAEVLAEKEGVLQYHLRITDGGQA